MRILVAVIAAAALIGVATTAQGAPPAAPAEQHATASPSAKRVIAQQRAALRRASARVEQLRRQISTQKRTMRDLRLTIEETWVAAGEEDDLLREGTLPANVAAKLAAANAAAAAAQSALLGSITAQIAALPPNVAFRDVLSAACSRARQGGVGWSCSTYFAPGYSSYTFD